MKRLFITLGLIGGAVLLFILGLRPGANILTAGVGAPTESYILIGTGRAAIFITALCEYALGCLLGCAITVLFIKLTKKT